MNGTQSPDAQKALNANSNGSNSNNSSLAAKKRKKDLKPIITMEGANQADGCPRNTQQHGVACCVTSQGTAVKQVEKSVDIAHSGIVPFALSLWGTVGLGLDRTTRPHKSWAFTNLESLDRSLGPLYLISAWPALVEVHLVTRLLHLSRCLAALG
ncbi:hypothetical protein FSST1_008933 [Fusarium sambucinum]